MPLAHQDRRAKAGADCTGVIEIHMEEKLSASALNTVSRLQSVYRTIPQPYGGLRFPPSWAHHGQCWLNECPEWGFARNSASTS